MSLISEIRSQPEVLKRLLENIEEIRGVVREMRKQKAAFIFLAARGSSDNAGLYAKYLWGSANRLPLALAAPSLYSIYKESPRLSKCMVVGISQSGQSPDIVSVIKEGKKQGVMTLAITNDVNSPLANESDVVIDLLADQEKAVAATKTYTAELMTIALISALLNDDGARLEALHRVPDTISEALKLENEIIRITERYRFMKHCVVLGRGYNFATAFEWSLKLKELAYVAAEPYSTADFKHGPVAIVTQGFPVLAIAPGGLAFDNVLETLSALRKEVQADLLVISNQEQALTLSNSPIRLPEDLPEWLSPLVAIIPAQLFSYHLTRVKGFDTENPRGLAKVTLTV